MLLIHSNWADQKSFRMIPITAECPYAEILFDPGPKFLVIVSKIVKEGLHMLPKLNENGDPEQLKVGKRPNNNLVKEERKTLKTFYEHYVTNEEDIKKIIHMFAVNADSFEYAPYMAAPSPVITPEPKKIITP